MTDGGHAVVAVKTRHGSDVMIRSRARRVGERVAKRDTRFFERSRRQGLGHEDRRSSDGGSDVPEVGLRCADSARIIPPAVVVSASAILTSTRSAVGAICGRRGRGRVSESAD
jgi:hypothetical protein